MKVLVHVRITSIIDRLRGRALLERLPKISMYQKKPSKASEPTSEPLQAPLMSVWRIAKAGESCHWSGGCHWLPPLVPYLLILGHRSAIVPATKIPKTQKFLGRCVCNHHTRSAGWFWLITSVPNPVAMVALHSHHDLRGVNQRLGHDVFQIPLVQNHTLPHGAPNSL